MLYLYLDFETESTSIEVEKTRENVAMTFFH